jgi:Ulp1 family protease
MSMAVASTAGANPNLRGDLDHDEFLFKKKTPAPASKGSKNGRRLSNVDADDHEEFLFKKKTPAPASKGSKNGRRLTVSV